MGGKSRLRRDGGRDELNVGEYRGRQNSGLSPIFPDVFVTCHPDDHRAELAMRHPVLVAEILSPSTAAYDRGDKFIAYRTLPTLKEYLLIDPDRQQVELFRKGADSPWVLHDFTLGQTVQLTSIDAAITWERLFRNVD